MGKLKGQNELKRFREGKELTYKQAIKAQCFACNGEEDGSSEDCKGDNCPLYPFFRKWLYKPKSSILRAEDTGFLNTQDKGE